MSCERLTSITSCSAIGGATAFSKSVNDLSVVVLSSLPAPNKHGDHVSGQLGEVYIRYQAKVHRRATTSRSSNGQVTRR